MMGEGLQGDIDNEVTKETKKKNQAEKGLYFGEGERKELERGGEEKGLNSRS